MAEPVDPRASTLFSPAAPGGDPLIGARLIDQYVIEKKLGAGGMGAVYLAEQTTVKRPAVIKVIHPAGAGNDDLKARFELEARAASQLNHPHIVTIYNYGQMANGTLFLAMEFLDGTSLDEAAKKGPLPIARAARIVDAIADALGEAHRRGVIHRDVKPSNVMLVARGEAKEDFVKVLDFGLARLEGAELTASGMVCGTPKYMSPEQLRGKKLDGRADLYSLAVVLYELVTGRTPFRADEAAGYLYQHVHVPPPRASSLAPKAKIPLALDDFLERALAKAPGDRPATAAAFRDELRRAVASPAPAPEPKPAPSGPKPAPEPKPAAEPRPATPVFRPIVEGARSLVARLRPKKKPLAERILAAFRAKPRRPFYRRPVWLAAAGAVLLALAAVGWLAFFSDDERAAELAPDAAPAAKRPTKSPAPKPSLRPKTPRRR